MGILCLCCECELMTKEEWELDQLLNLEIDLAYERDNDEKNMDNMLKEFGFTFDQP